MPRRSGSSQRWRQRQQRDVYVDQASRDGWRSRAVFKLEQIQEKERLLRAGINCVDVGAAPGGWSQLAARLVAPSGSVLAVDLLPMEPIPHVDFVQGDFTDAATVAELLRRLGGRRVDLVMSDLSPNISGNRTTDQARSIALLEAVVRFAEQVLRPGGALLLKAFQGAGLEEFVDLVRMRFGSLKRLKPKASRPESREIYLLARNYGM